MDEENYDFLKKLSNEEHGDVSKAVRELVNKGRIMLACISHHPTVEARHRAARTSLRLLAVLNVQFKYACARQAARASS